MKSTTVSYEPTYTEGPLIKRQSFTYTRDSLVDGATYARCFQAFVLILALLGNVATAESDDIHIEDSIDDIVPEVLRAFSQPTTSVFSQLTSVSWHLTMNAATDRHPKNSKQIQVSS